VRGGALQEAQMEAMLTTIAAWLSFNLMLPPVYDHPRLELGPGLEAFYDDATRTIHLPTGWTGGSPAELSVLVHEMVRHVQNVAGLVYACPEAREKLPYAAQRQWLALFGRELMKEFNLDPVTLLIRTNCVG
jgi:hypothetical protein